MVSFEVCQGDCVEDANGCWIWQRSFNGDYGAKWNGTGMALAHRVYYERHKGPIPQGLHIDHLCGVKACVNPDHLEAVTQRENNRRSRSAKITEADVRHIRRNGLTPRQVVDHYGLEASYAWRVVVGQYWVDVE